MLANITHMKTSEITTPLGIMLAVADDQALYLLEFLDRKDLEKKVQRLTRATSQPIISGKTSITLQIEEELKKYFAGELKDFLTPLAPIGSLFQKKVWEALQTIESGTTKSYAELATLIGKPTAYRAAALANGANPLPIIIPCHRVINHNGQMGGYSGGLWRKEWLLKHEMQLHMLTNPTIKEIL